MNIKYDPNTNQILCGFTDITEQAVATVIQWIIHNDISFSIQNKTTQEHWVIVSQKLEEDESITLH